MKEIQNEEVREESSPTSEANIDGILTDGSTVEGISNRSTRLQSQSKSVERYMQAASRSGGRVVMFALDDQAILKNGDAVEVKGLKGAWSSKGTVRSLGDLDALGNRMYHIKYDSDGIGAFGAGGGFERNVVSSRLRRIKKLKVFMSVKEAAKSTNLEESTILKAIKYWKPLRDILLHDDCCSACRDFNGTEIAYMGHDPACSHYQAEPLCVGSGLYFRWKDRLDSEEDNDEDNSSNEKSGSEKENRGNGSIERDNGEKYDDDDDDDNEGGGRGEENDGRRSERGDTSGHNSNETRSSDRYSDLETTNPLHAIRLAEEIARNADFDVKTDDEDEDDRTNESFFGQLCEAVAAGRVLRFLTSKSSSNKDDDDDDGGGACDCDCGCSD